MDHQQKITLTVLLSLGFLFTESCIIKSGCESAKEKSKVEKIEQSVNQYSAKDFINQFKKKLSNYKGGLNIQFKVDELKEEGDYDFKFKINGVLEDSTRYSLTWKKYDYFDDFFNRYSTGNYLLDGNFEKDSKRIELINGTVRLDSIDFKHHFSGKQRNQYFTAKKIFNLQFERAKRYIKSETPEIYDDIFNSKIIGVDAETKRRKTEPKQVILEEYQRNFN